jgi:hypothetical protein
MKQRTKIASADALAASMEQVMTSEEHQQVFQLKPKVKTASAPVATPEPTVADQIMEVFLATSAQLDQMGFEDSSTRILQAAQIFQAELQKLADDEEFAPDMDKLREEVAQEDKIDPEVWAPEDTFAVGHPWRDDHKYFMNPLLEKWGPNEFGDGAERVDMDPANMSEVYPHDWPGEGDESWEAARPVGFLESDESDYPQELDLPSLLDDPTNEFEEEGNLEDLGDEGMSHEE